MKKCVEITVDPRLEQNIIMIEKTYTWEAVSQSSASREESTQVELTSE